MGSNHQSASDEGSIKEAAKKEKNTRLTELADTKAIMESKGGRRFVWRQLSLAGIYRTSFTGNSHTFFNEGKRQMGLYLLADVMEAGPDLYLKMTQENKGD